MRPEAGPASGWELGRARQAGPCAEAGAVLTRAPVLQKQPEVRALPAGFNYEQIQRLKGRVNQSRPTGPVGAPGCQWVQPG